MRVQRQKAIVNVSVAMPPHVFAVRLSSGVKVLCLPTQESSGTNAWAGWPTPLGALPCESSLPATHLSRGPGNAALSALCTRVADGGLTELEFVACAHLLPPPVDDMTA